MKNFAFVVILLVIGGLLYFKNPAKSTNPTEGTGTAPADTQKPLDDPSRPNGEASNDIKIVQDDLPQTAESTPAADIIPTSTTDQDFENDVINSPAPVVVEFWKPGSKYCVQLKPELVKLATGVTDRYKIVTVNTQECVETTKRFSVTEVPTLFVFENGKITKELRERSAREIKAELGNR